MNLCKVRGRAGSHSVSYNQFDIIYSENIVTFYKDSELVHITMKHILTF